MGERGGKIQVLLSTYNGEKYLAEQLNSLLEQTHPNLFITIRDDGSSDNTVAIIQEYVAEFPEKIEAYYEENIGVIASFFNLLSRHTHSDSEYVCFCDQDDVWMAEKLERAIYLLNERAGQIPMMYVCPTQMVTETMAPLNIWPPTPQRGVSFLNALVENIAVGATTVLNCLAVNILQQNLPNTKRIVMHDWWAYLVVSAYGQVIYDDKPYIYYRQHQNNVIGGQQGFYDKWVKKWRSYKKHRTQKILWNQAKEFERCWGDDLPLEFQSELEEFLLTNRGIVRRASYALNTRLYRQSRLDNFVFRFMMIKGDILK
ncbi:Glycosyl transferase family 2 [Paenibacillus sp. cl6col]|uniref:Glycosyltransferase family 2 protein n=1 Tax=Paenibacillus alvei TaxID=44250 RepID=A0ABT4E7H5_PAEAL|nr:MULTISPECIES: glycosyltransferase family 2 protein [Paenibacillus]MCY9528593.1 glycosyltransferase family 2 protein [Paenibacillus alvei]SDG21969.1 Glycosyl transferase family 2 [Paenibacillus sp. cl6col]